MTERVSLRGVYDEAIHLCVLVDCHADARNDGDVGMEMKGLCLIWIASFLAMTITLHAEEPPKWIMEPQLFGQSCEVGSGENEQIAMIVAKAALAKSIKVQVATKSESSQTATKSHFTTSSTHTAKELIKQSKKTDQTVLDGLVYVRVCAPLDEIREKK
jgi:hypothetical protein